MYRFMLALIVLATACGLPLYTQPALSAPHSTVKVRMNYHSAPQRTLAESLQVGEQRLPTPATNERGASHDATFHYRVHPEPATWTVGSVFSHSEMRTRTETYQERYSCGTTRVGTGTSARNQTRYCNRTQTRQVTSNVTVVDAACETGFQLSPRPGATYILQYDFFGNDRCTARVFEEVTNADGVGLVPVH